MPACLWPARTPARRALALTLSAMLVAAGLTLAAPVATAAEPTPQPTPLGDLRADASGPVSVARDVDGAVVAVTSRDGEAVLTTDATTPAAATREVLAEHGEVLGIDGAESRAQVEQVLASSTGGTVVRAAQVVDGVPVFGGQVVTVLDAARDVVSLTGATTRGPVVLPEPTVSPARAADAATRAVAGAAGIDTEADALAATVAGRRVYDPALVGEGDTGPGARGVWEVEVRGSDRQGDPVRQTVLVGTERGEVALRLDAAPRALARQVCDHGGAARAPETDPVPVCATATRGEGDGPTGQADVDAAYDHLGETAAAYDELAGVDLTDLLGGPRLTATVRWCATDAPCPYGNAFWDGRQVVLGEGVALADDVVAHELTHGYVERTAGLFYHQQSGAINESFADVVGEVVDHRHGADDDSGWTVGEDVTGPLAALLPRHLADPERDRMPDRMTSARWVDEHGLQGRDSGGVHSNLGVGNKTAYLISQGTSREVGGAFNGQVVAGIDGDDPDLAKTGLLYLETIPTLTSGAGYAELGRALDATCVRLAAAGTGGFVPSDCVSVRQATAATELDRQPTVGRQPQQVASTCPAGTTQVLVARDDDAAPVTPGVSDLGLAASEPAMAPLVLRPRSGEPGGYAVSGESSLLLLDPLPQPPPDGPGDPSTVSATSRAVTLPVAQGGTYLHFVHAYSFDQEAEDVFNDGGALRVEQRTRAGGWVDVGPLAWTNGPDRAVVGAGATPFTGFGGDSRGWGSSRVDLTAYAGETVRLVFRVEGDAEYAAWGWWLDDVRLYSCAAPLTDAPVSPEVTVSGNAPGATASLTWRPPTRRAEEVRGYRVTRSDTGASTTYAAGERRAAVGGLSGAADVVLRVAAIGADGGVGPAAQVTVEATTATVTPSATRVGRGQRFALTGKVVDRGTTTAVAGVPVALQQLPSGSRTWRTVARGTTPASGAVRWTLSQRSSASYRVVSTSVSRFTGTTSAARTVRLR